MLENINTKGYGKDFSIWNMDPSNNFTVRSTYLALFNLRGRSQLEDTFKLPWSIKIPGKVTFLVWRMLYDRLPTKTNLKRRNIQTTTNDTLCVCLVPRYHPPNMRSSRSNVGYVVERDV